MTKAEIKAIADKYGMRIIRNDITHEAWGLILDACCELPELESIVTSDVYPVVGKREYIGDPDCGFVRYTVVCPSDWFDLMGWR